MLHHQPAESTGQVGRAGRWQLFPSTGHGTPHVQVVLHLAAHLKTGTLRNKTKSKTKHSPDRGREFRAADSELGTLRSGLKHSMTWCKLGCWQRLSFEPERTAGRKPTGSRSRLFFYFPIYKLLPRELSCQCEAALSIAYCSQPEVKPTPFMCLHTYTHTHTQHTHAHTHTSTYTHAHTHTCTYTRACTHTHPYARTHTRSWGTEGASLHVRCSEELRDFFFLCKDFFLYINLQTDPPSSPSTPFYGIHALSLL